MVKVRIIRYRKCRPGASGSAGYVWNGPFPMPCEWREEDMYILVNELADAVKDGVLSMDSAIEFIRNNVVADEETIGEMIAILLKNLK